MEAHGRLFFSWDGDILFVEAHGPFNVEGVNSVKDQYISTLEKNHKACFSIIEIFDDLSLTSPDGFKIIGEFWQEVFSYGCEALAIVVPSQFQKRVIEKILPEKNSKVFDDLEDAKNWVKDVKKKI